MHTILDCLQDLRDTDTLEVAVFNSYVGCTVNHSGLPLHYLRWCFGLCDRDRLRALGDPLPPGESFVLYRGVSGRGPARRKRGLSWTTDLDKAWWFAKRLYKDKPAVFKAVVPREAVYFCTNDRRESEYVCHIAPDLPLKRVFQSN